MPGRREAGARWWLWRTAQAAYGGSAGVAGPQVEPGQRVSAGDVLGTVGIVGCECAEESHIHLEVKQGEAYLDPAKALT